MKKQIGLFFMVSIFVMACEKTEPKKVTKKEPIVESKSVSTVQAETDKFREIEGLINKENIEELTKLKESGIKFNEILDTKSVKAGLPGPTLIQRAIESGNKDILKLIAGENYKVKENMSKCSLVYAVELYDEKNAIEFLNILLTSGANINCNKDLAGHGGALAAAIDKNSLILTKYLIEKGANVDQSFGAIGSPAIVAFHVGQKKENHNITKLIVSHSKKLDMKDDNGKTVLDLAKESNNSDLVNFIKSR